MVISVVTCGILTHFLIQYLPESGAAYTMETNALRLCRRTGICKRNAAPRRNKENSMYAIAINGSPPQRRQYGNPAAPDSGPRWKKQDGKRNLSAWGGKPVRGCIACYKCFEK